MGGQHQEVVQKADGHIVHFTAFAAGFTITFEPLAQIRVQKKKRIVHRKDLVQKHSYKKKKKKKKKKESTFYFKSELLRVLPCCLPLDLFDTLTQRL